MKIVVIGGGLLGLLTARECSLAGHSVTVLEKGQIGAESSWAGGGILSPLYAWQYPDSVNALAKWSQQHYPELANELAKSGDVDPQWTRSGLLVLDEDKFDAAMEWNAEYGLDCVRLDARQIQQNEPELCIGQHNGLFFPEIAQIRNPRMVKATAQACDQAGVKLLHNTTVNSLIIKNKNLQGISTDNTDIEADKVVVCAGAWSSEILAAQNVEVKIRPLRGQMIMFRAPPGLINHITLYRGRYVIPRRDGRVLVGSTLEDVGFEKNTTEAALQELKQFAVNFYPVLKEYEVERHWCGLRPATEHGVPYISAVPEIDGLFINAGHFRNGVILAPASARLVTDLMLSREPIVDPAPYAIGQIH